MNQFLDGTGHVLNGHGGIDAVLVEQVDVVGSQTLQGSFGHFLDVLGAAVEFAGGLAVGVDVEAKLGGNDDPLAPGRERLTK